jgi:hypothetical protein
LRSASCHRASGRPSSRTSPAPRAPPSPAQRRCCGATVRADRFHSDITCLGRMRAGRYLEVYNLLRPWIPLHNSLRSTEEIYSQGRSQGRRKHRRAPEIWVDLSFSSVLEISGASRAARPTNPLADFGNERSSRFGGESMAGRFSEITIRGRVCSNLCHG